MARNRRVNEANEGVTRSHYESFLLYRNKYIHKDDWKRVSIKSKKIHKISF